MDSMNGNCSSQSSSPVFSWSPLTTRKHLGAMEKKKCENDNEKNYYTNCDNYIWLRSCEQEIIDPLPGKNLGTIPKWLNGALIRNGPGSLKVGDSEFAHLFDSSALLHRFEINNGKVTYQCRFLESESYKRNWAANRIVLTEFGTKSVADPCHTIFQRIAAVFKAQTSDNSMISVYPFGDELYAFNETPIIHKINPVTLATENRLNVKEHISIHHHTSHPHVMQDGTVYNIGLSVYATGPYHIVICFPKNNSKASKTMFENVKIVGAIPARWPFSPSYMHTFGITENYFIIVEQPLSLSVAATLKAKLKNEPLASSFRWYKDEYAQINVISKETGRLAYKFFAQAFFYLHIIHQYEIDDYIVLDICIYRDPSMLDCMYTESLKSMHKNPNFAKMFRSRPARFVLPLKPEPRSKEINKNLVMLPNTEAKAYYLPNGKILVKPEQLCNLGCETPRINYENYLGKPYRYFYALSSDVDCENPGTIIKVDTHTKTVKTWCEVNCYPSEPIFVPLPGSESEDDGAVLAAMVWGKDDTNRVGLIILDARTFIEIGRAEFQTPSPVPKCLHGWFLPQSI